MMRSPNRNSTISTPRRLSPTLRGSTRRTILRLESEVNALALSSLLSSLAVWIAVDRETAAPFAPRWGYLCVSDPTRPRYCWRIHQQSRPAVAASHALISTRSPPSHCIRHSEPLWRATSQSQSPLGDLRRQPMSTDEHQWALQSSLNPVPIPPDLFRHAFHTSWDSFWLLANAQRACVSSRVITCLTLPPPCGRAYRRNRNFGFQLASNWDSPAALLTVNR